jgi:hypothetical protein
MNIVIPSISSKLYPLLWRFLPVVDPQVSLYFSRDLDSHLNRRELEAVKEFLGDRKASKGCEAARWGASFGSGRKTFL